jgi:hypothetical protein
MNGIHDMGGMQGMGPIEYENDEPVFHAAWEGRVHAMIQRMILSGLTTRAETESGHPAEGSAKFVPALNAADVPAFMRMIPPMLKDQVAPRFRVGQRVRARNINPVTHTRLPRYVRGKAGTIEHDRGVAALPDTNVYRRGENPQHVYSVRFSARELWGEQAAPQDAVYVELWDDYLEPA